MHVALIQEAITNPLGITEGGRSLLDIMALAGGFQWPIMAVFVLGLGALINALIRLALDRRGARKLRRIAVSAADASDLEPFSRTRAKSLFHRVLHGTLQRQSIGVSNEALVTGVGELVDMNHESYALTHRLVTYCSGAAGGLGLAGTLVGMYSSFSAAGTDPQTVYVGISLALVSTLLGVAASLILEAADTIVFRWTSKYHSRGKAWGVDVCLRLAQLEQQSTGGDLARVD